jgi:hypothetical protein
VGGGGLPSWAQTFVNASAVALLAFLFLLNLTQVCFLCPGPACLAPDPRFRPPPAFWPPIQPSVSSPFFSLSIFSE